MTISSAEIESSDRAPEIGIVLVARDRRFVRVTSFLLTRAGYAVETAHSTASLVELLARSAADVVVVDGSDPSNAGARVVALLATVERRRGLVVVGETTEVRPLQAPVAVAKWTSFDCLLDAIEREYRRTRALNGASRAG